MGSIIGTLTDEERFKINDHVIMTIKMPEQLPFPDNMKEVPHMAGEHHETMDSTGYPRRLSKAELSIPSRIMAIADIFEALTASGRPYKKSKNAFRGTEDHVLYEKGRTYRCGPV